MKRTRPKAAPNRQIIDEASAWFVDFRVGDIDTNSRDEFNAWLRRSPEHIQAYLDIASTYAELPALKPGELDTDQLIAGARQSPENLIHLETSPRGTRPRPGFFSRLRRKSDLNEQPFLGSASDNPSPRDWREGAHEVGSEAREDKRGGRRYFALAASILLVVAGTGGWFYAQRGTYSTDIGEQRSLTLADGSTVVLNSRSQLKIRYTENERLVDLLEGQALFEVAKDSTRPFTVRSNGTQVRAVGTQFDVYRKQTGTTVTVLQGTVAVVPENRENQNPAADAYPSPGDSRGGAHAVGGEVKGSEVLLSAGQQLTVTLAAIEPPRAANIAVATAWTQRRLVFDNTPLSEVAEEFSRYSTRPMIVDPDATQNFHISGTYSSSNHDSLLRFLRAQPGIRVTETRTEIHVSAANVPP